MRLVAAISLLAATAFTPAFAARPIEFAASAPAGGAIVLPLGSEAELATRGAAIDAGVRGQIASAIRAAGFEYAKNATLSLRGVGPYSQILVVGTGKESLDTKAVQDIGGIAARDTAKDDGPVTVLASGLAPQVPDAAAQLGIGARLGGYSFDEYKYEDPAKPRPAGRGAALTIVGDGADQGRSGYAAQGLALTEGVTLARDLISEPANVIYPESFVERARAAFKGVSGVTINVLDVPAMERLGMGSILSVGKGSVRPPRMLIIEYKGGGSDAPIVLAGKGITFDSGGISLKPGSGMWRMKSDMSGASVVTGTALSLAKSRAPVNVVAIAALAENMPSGAASRPGDVVKAMNGKTIEIISTDAEGRLVLADAVVYAERQYRPAAIIDIATLTGAVVGALGNEYAGLMSRNDALAGQLDAAGKTTGEHLWRLPLHPSYAKDMSSDIADIKNSGDGAGPGAGTGGHFIGYFVTDATPWAHLDIAGTAWTAEPSPTVPKGAVGYGVRLLDRFVRDFQPVGANASTAD